MQRPFEISYIGKVLPELLPFLGVTFATLFITVIVGGILGFIISYCKIKGNVVAKAFADVYIYILRATPSVVLLFVVFYGLPELLLGTFGIDTNEYHKIFFVSITFSLLFAATISEVMRSSYEAIDKGQMEAALSIGMSGKQAFFRIILPQCVVVAIPNVANSLIILIKEGALAYTIGLIDVMGKGILIIGNHYGAHALETYLALAIIYWSITIVIEKGFGRLEERMNRGRKNIAAGQEG